MHSPLPSPSLRTITHLPRGGYFPPHPPTISPAPRGPHTTINMVHTSPQPGLASPLHGCLKHSGHITAAPPSSPSPSHLHASTVPRGGQAHHPGLHHAAAAAAAAPGQYPFEYAGGHHPHHPVLERRRTTRTSAIPLSSGIGLGAAPGLGGGPGVSAKPNPRGLHTYRHASVDTACETARRRPSFKIDLPPRCIPADAASNPHGNGSLAFSPAAKPAAGARAGSTPFTERPPPPALPPHHSSSSLNSNSGVFRDPFAHSAVGAGNTGTSAVSRGYIILQSAPSLVSPHQTAPGFFDDSDPASTTTSTFLSGWGRDARESRENWEDSGRHGREDHVLGGHGTLVGLGYSLNKLRAPTPWVRGHADDAEWLAEEDLQGMTDLETHMRSASLD